MAFIELVDRAELEDEDPSLGQSEEPHQIDLEASDAVESEVEKK